MSGIVASSLQVASRRVIDRHPRTEIEDTREKSNEERENGDPSGGQTFFVFDLENVLSHRGKKDFPALSPRPRAIMFPSLIVQTVRNAVDPSAVCLSIDRSIESFGKDVGDCFIGWCGSDCRVRVCVLTTDFNTIKAKHKAFSVAFR